MFVTAKNILRKFSWRSTALYFLIFVLASFAGNLWMTRDQVQGDAPEIVAQSLTNSLYRQDFKQLKNSVLVYFFADWCPICKLQQSVIASIDEDVQVIAIAMQSGTVENVRQYVADNKIPYLVINDEHGKISAEYGVKGVPAAFIINPQGRIKYSTRGYATEVGLRSRVWLANVL